MYIKVLSYEIEILQGHYIGIAYMYCTCRVEVHQKFKSLQNYSKTFPLLSFTFFNQQKISWTSQSGFFRKVGEHK